MVSCIDGDVNTTGLRGEAAIDNGYHSMHPNKCHKQAVRVLTNIYKSTNCRFTKQVIQFYYI